ncbi:hypothetical protein [Streptomyces yanii]|uniref:Uncharacterized protein n=1 Tax=Streptomyces yanii TaxID=78510 RepID=A0ABV5R958_9ACTN
MPGLRSVTGRAPLASGGPSTGYAVRRRRTACRITVGTNPSDKPVKVSLLAARQNAERDRLVVRLAD